jgi:hypothetical protein
MLNQKLFLMLTLLLSTITASGASHEGLSCIDICASCDKNRSLTFEITIDSTQEKAWLLSGMDRRDLRYPLLLETLRQDYNETIMRLTLWLHNESFCQGECKRTLYGIYRERIEKIKKILYFEAQYYFENVVNQRTLYF